MMKTADCFLSQSSATPKASDVCVNGFADNEHTKKIVREQTASVDWFKRNRINLEKNGDCACCGNTGYNGRGQKNSD